MQLLNFHFNAPRSLKYANASRKLLGWKHFCDEKAKKPDLYRTLGLKSTASASEIKKAYYDLTFKYHPDRNEDNLEASTKFREVTEAYEVLGNYGLRKRYDKGLPLPSKSSAAPRKPIVEPKVQYQSFFDSKTKPLKFETKKPSIGEREVDPLDEVNPRMRDAEKKFEADRGLQTIFAVVFGGILFFLVYNSKK